MTHDLKNVRLHFRFVPHDEGMLLIACDPELPGTAYMFTLLKRAEAMELFNLLINMLDNTDQDGEGYVIPAFTPADAYAYQTTGEVPPGWFQNEPDA